ncbi:MAG: hypothetical protein ACRC1G_10755 [Bradyrhizobium sp.]|nr:hypothetical protein [Bradyrhizobium sp.]
MAIEKISPRRSEKDERRPPRDPRKPQQAVPSFLNEGLESVRDSHC